MSLFNRLFGSRKKAASVPADVPELPFAEADSAPLAESGSTPETAITVPSIAAEYQWVKANCPGYRPGGQALVRVNGKPYDRLTLRNTDGRERTVFFDISTFFGR
jgi:hypothetical protein